MKTLTELYKEVMASGELKKEYLAAADEGKAVEFLKAHGVEATEAELDEFLGNPANLPQGEISDDELDAVSGGACLNRGYPVVTIMNSCVLWTCDTCHIARRRTPVMTPICTKCGQHSWCMNCEYCHYERALWLCKHPDRYGRSGEPGAMIHYEY